MGRHGVAGSSVAVSPSVALSVSKSRSRFGFAICRALATCFTKNVLPEPQGASITNVYGGSTAMSIFRKFSISLLRRRGSWARALSIASGVGSSSTRFMVAAFFLWARVSFLCRLYFILLPICYSVFHLNCLSIGGLAAVVFLLGVKCARG